MNSQQGIALLISLVILVVAALLGLSSYQASQLEERMAGNHRFSVAALQGAEAGVNEALGAVLAFSYSPGNTFCSDLSSSLGSSDFDESGQGYSSTGVVAGGELSVRYKVYLECDGDGLLVGYSRGAVLGAGDGENAEELSARRVKFGIVPPGFETVRGMLAEGRIRVTGNSSVRGNIHSNDKVDIAIRETGNPADRVVSRGSITAVNEVTVGGDVVQDGNDCENVVCAAGQSPRQQVPPAEEAIEAVQEAFLTWLSDEASGIPDGWVANSDVVNIENYVTVLAVDGSNNCAVPEGGFATKSAGLDYAEDDDSKMAIASGKNHVYYCPGNLDTNADFVGVTVVTEGDFVHRGSMTIDEQDGRESFVIAGGSITLNGSTNPNTPTPTYATFLSGGNFTQTGNSHIYGAIVSGSEIDIRGGVRFTARDTGKLLRPVSGYLDGWVELEDPADEGDITS